MLSNREELLEKALVWALNNGVYLSGSGFEERGCGCCACGIEPPVELTGVLAEVAEKVKEGGR